MRKPISITQKLKNIFKSMGSFLQAAVDGLVPPFEFDKPDIAKKPSNHTANTASVFKSIHRQSTRESQSNTNKMETKQKESKNTNFKPKNSRSCPSFLELLQAAPELVIPFGSYKPRRTR